jgi:hypothetical protein
MDLADDRLITSILSGPGISRQPRSNAIPEIRPASRPRQCQCGRCPACLDNARWERIFKQKFADPDYYSYSRIPQGSSLNWR